MAVARRKAMLEAATEGTQATILCADLRDHDTLCRAIGEFSPDVIVNNAGVGHGITGLADISPDNIREAIDINLATPILLTAAALPAMRQKGRGHIVNLGSISGLHTTRSALYGATKSAIHMFSQNLRSELAGTGIRVTEICPGRVTSDFYVAAEGDQHRLDELKDSGIRELDPADVASAILYALEAPQHVNVSTIEILPTDQAVGGVQMKRSPQNREP